MAKFIINNVVIEKSDKDITTDVKYNFEDGLNVICGNNEVGKSSLMKFIKDGLFRVKDTDTGKIYFKLDNKQFRCDIKNARNLEQRCKIFDEENNSFDYDFLVKTINQNYFEQGFYITLDDLMSIQNKDTSKLVNVIKDPSGEKLTNYINQIKNDTKKLLGENGRLTKETSSIIEKITSINKQINELSYKEADYNNAIQNIKQLSEEIEKLVQQEDYLKIISNLNDLKSQLDDFQEEYNCLQVNFNEKLFNDKENYLNLIQNSGKYESNLKSLEINKEKLNSFNSKINTNLANLRSNYFIEIEENNVLNFDINYNNIKQIKDLLQQKDLLDKDLIKYKSDKTHLEEILLNLKHEYSMISEKLNSKEDINELKKLFDFIEDKLNQYNFLSSKISNMEQDVKNNLNAIPQNKNLIILFSTLCVLSIISAIISFGYKFQSVTIISILIIICSILGLLNFKGSDNKSNNIEVEKDIELRTKILSDLKTQLKNYNYEIENINSYLPIKINSIKQEIQNKIIDIQNILEKISENKKETNINNDKSTNIINKIEEINEEIKQIQEKIESLMQNLNSEIQIKPESYIEIVEIFKNLQEDIKSKKLLEKEIQELSNENNEITNKLNSFILNNDINIVISEKYDNNTREIKDYNEKNAEIKNKLDVLNAKIQTLKSKINEIEENKKSYSFNSENISNLQLEEIQNEKEEKQKIKKEFEFEKRQLESFEGLDNLKIQKNILIDEYRKKIAEIMKNKMIIFLIETAKNNFDRVQPDLKNAQKYLSILTDGKYSKINLDLEEIENEDKTKIKKWVNLSRGTKEQLYLALRLGYASNYSKDKVTLEPNGRADLPIIIDDAFVNFDLSRTQNAIKCLLEFSKTNQVLFFTCHSEIMQKYFEQTGEKINIVKM